jgi:hypothetical protein
MTLRRRISRAALALHRRLGAKGIFESRTLWAGHLGYMSDTSEVGHARATSCVKCPSILSWLSFPSSAVTAVSHLPAEDQQL